MVETLGKGLKIDIRRIHMGEKLPPSFGIDIARRHRYRLDSLGVAGLGRIDGVFEENHRIIIGEGDAAALKLDRCGGDGFRAGLIGQSIKLARFADVPVLAEFAGEVAACRAEGKNRRTGQKVIERLFLDGIDAKTRGAAIGGEHQALRPSGADETKPSLSGAQDATARTKIASEPPIRETGPVASEGKFGKISLGHRGSLAQNLPMIPLACLLN